MLAGEQHPAKSYLHDGTNSNAYYIYMNPTSGYVWPSTRKTMTISCSYKATATNQAHTLINIVGTSRLIRLDVQTDGKVYFTCTIKGTGDGTYVGNGDANSDGGYVETIATDLNDGNWHTLEAILNPYSSTIGDRMLVKVDDSRVTNGSADAFQPSKALDALAQDTPLIFGTATPTLISMFGKASPYQCMEGYVYNFQLAIGGTVVSSPLGIGETVITGDSTLAAAWTDGGSTHITASSNTPYNS